MRSLPECPKPLGHKGQASSTLHLSSCVRLPGEQAPSSLPSVRILREKEPCTNDRHTYHHARAAISTARAYLEQAASRIFFPRGLSRGQERPADSRARRRGQYRHDEPRVAGGRKCC